MSLVRLFVSSTFEDFHRERDALDQMVFPAVEGALIERGHALVPIDLRHGITEQLSREHEVVEICLREIERCAEQTPDELPFFLVLLGDRAGWRPLPDPISPEEWNALSPGARDVLCAEYELDENALPDGAWVLRRRPAGEAPSVWREVEERLRDLIAAEMEMAGSERFGGWLRPVTEREVLTGLGQHAEAARRTVCVHCRTTAPGTVPPGQDAQAAAALLAQLSAAQAHVIDIDRDPDRPATHLPRFVAETTAALRVVLEGGLAGSSPAAADEEEAQRGYASTRLGPDGGLVGREAELRQLVAALDGAARRPVLLVGEPGTGKSAVAAAVAAASAAVRERRTVARFVGATPASATAEGLVRSMIAALSPDGDDALLSDLELRDLGSELRIALDAAEEPTWIIVDGVDQLPQGTLRAWLPAELPAHVAMLITSTEPVAVAGATQLTLAGLPVATARELLGTWLATEGRRLTPAQLDVLLPSHETREVLPLWLRLAADEARRWRSADDVESRRLPAALPGLIRHWLEVQRSRHPRVIVDATLRALTASRFGLSERELIRHLSNLEDVRRHVAEHRDRFRMPGEDGQSWRLPAVLWSRLWLDLGAYRMEREHPEGRLLDLLHRVVREELARALEAGDPALHLELAALLAEGPAEHGRSFTRRALEEVPHHLAAARAYGELEGWVSHPAILQAHLSPAAGNPRAGLAAAISDLRAAAALLERHRAAAGAPLP